MGVAVFLYALCMTLYPLISNYVNEKYASEIHTAYEEVIQQADSNVLLEARAQAASYNQSVIPGTATGGAYSREALQAASQDYEELLNLSGNGTMGYIQIPRIDVDLPIYHGTDSDVLERGIGHLLGSSLPVGGESTHTILTGHSGMASQKMFTDLEQLTTGDVFYLQILDETLAYQVDSIQTVLPHDTGLLGVYPGEDYCTLVTCTPYGVNTHRLLVRGTRIPYEEAEELTQQLPPVDETGSTCETQYLKGILWGLALAAILTAAAVFLYYRYIRRGENYERR